MTIETQEQKEAAAGPDIQSGSLFPLPETPLGQACEKFVGIVEQIAALKLTKDEAEANVITEMHIEKRDSLKVSVGADNYLFEIKDTEEKLRCVKITKQPQPKTVTVDEA